MQLVVRVPALLRLLLFAQSNPLSLIDRVLKSALYTKMAQEIGSFSTGARLGWLPQPNNRFIIVDETHNQGMPPCGIWLCVFYTFRLRIMVKARYV